MAKKVDKKEEKQEEKTPEIVHQVTITVYDNGKVIYNTNTLDVFGVIGLLQSIARSLGG